MKPYNIDIAVLFLFFSRAEQTQKVFAEIKKARPSKLFLYQDGPREGRADDVAGIAACREIVADIDWDCEVHRLYQEKNYGCDPSEYISQKWMFEHVDKGIILEDDDVPSQSFFPFCKELLDKYEHDPRVAMISGMNHMGRVEVDADYFFSRKHGPIWGWATWKRFVDMWDTDYKFLEDERTIKNLTDAGDLWPRRLASYHRHKATGREHYEDFVSSTCIFNAMFAIIPSRNLISNIGAGADAVHNKTELAELPPTVRRLFYAKTYDYDFPLRHPRYVVNDVENTAAIDRAMTLTWRDRLFLLLQRFKKH